MKKILYIALVIYLVYLLSKVLGRTDRNAKFLQSLQPSARIKFESFLNEIRALGYFPVIRDAKRSKEEQKKHYQKDKRNAKPGHGSHEFGLAIDLDLHKNKKIISKHTPKLIWQRTSVPEIARKHGILWGGHFKGYADNNHFYLLKA